MSRTKIWKSPKVGTVFEKRFNGKLYKLLVIKSNYGIGFSLDHQIYKSPTAAAKIIVKHEVNGWTFWKMNKEKQ
jgi:hypothetical protein